jgi:membrane protease YdiL (CAAX protease family)
MVLAGAVHVLIETAVSERVAGAFSAWVSMGFLVYVVWRARTTPGALRAWGLRADNFGPALAAHFTFVAVGGLALILYRAAAGSLKFGPSFWLTAALYPVWGTAQQFALQNLIARNLRDVLVRPWALVAVASALFGLSHYPRLDLVALTLVAGVGFTLIYRRFPNLWAVGLAHGALGALAIYLVVEEDPGRVILDFATGLLGTS